MLWCSNLWYWRKLLRVPWASRRSNQPILKEISPEYSLEGLILKLKLQYFGHLMGRADSLEKDPNAGKDWGQKGTTEDEMAGWHHWLNGYEFEQTLGDGEGQGSLVLQSTGLQRVRHDLATEQQNVYTFKQAHTYTVFCFVFFKFLLGYRCFTMLY